MTGRRRQYLADEQRQVQRIDRCLVVKRSIHCEARASQSDRPAHARSPKALAVLQAEHPEDEPAAAALLEPWIWPDPDMPALQATLEQLITSREGRWPRSQGTVEDNQPAWPVGSLR